MRYVKKVPLEGDHGIGLITSLSFSPDGQLPVWREEYAQYLHERNYAALKGIFPKAPAGAKADLEINGIRYSVKNSRGAKAAIVNHTSRKGFLKIISVLGMNISPLDTIIDEYWEKRTAGTIKEDICNSAESSPFSSHKRYLKPILEYFLFTGTPRGVSPFPADKMFIFSNPEDTHTYQILTQSEAVDSLWDNLTFSVRSKKGMPTTYDEVRDIDLAPWVRFYPTATSSPKGALHIRS